MAATSTHSAGSASATSSSQSSSSQSVSRSPTAARACARCSTMTDSGLWQLRSSAASSIGLYSTTRRRLDAAARRDDDHRLGVLDAGRELGRGEPAEHHRVHRPQPGAGEHRDDGLGHHRHVDDDAVALLDPERASAPANVATRSSSAAYVMVCVRVR